MTNDKKEADGMSFWIFTMCFCLQLNQPHSYNATLLLNPFQVS
jgi:hypothetical protein